MHRPRPPLDGFYWEDIEFLPARPPGPTRIERSRALLAGWPVQTALVAAMMAGIATLVAIPDDRDATLAVASAADVPETTGSIAPALRRSLSPD